MVWPCLENAHQLPPETAPEVQIQWQGRLIGGAPLRWCDLINRTWRGIINWSDSNGGPRSAVMHNTWLPCTGATDAGSYPMSLMGHGQQRCVCVRACVRACVPVCVHQLEIYIKSSLTFYTLSAQGRHEPSMGTHCNFHCVVVVVQEVNYR